MNSGTIFQMMMQSICVLLILNEEDEGGRAFQTSSKRTVMYRNFLCPCIGTALVFSLHASYWQMNFVQPLQCLLISFVSCRLQLQSSQETSSVSNAAFTPGYTLPDTSCIHLSPSTCILYR